MRGHKDKSNKAITSYTGEGQIGLDLIHIQTLEDFGFIKMVELILEWGRKKYEIKEGKKVYYVEDSRAMLKKDPTQSLLFGQGKYSNWSYAEEQEYQKLVYDYENNLNASLNDKYEVVYIQAKKPERLQEMIDKKLSLFPSIKDTDFATKEQLQDIWDKL